MAAITVNDDSRCSGDPNLDHPSCGKLATHVLMTAAPVRLFQDHDPGNLGLLVCDDHYGRGRVWLEGYALALTGGERVEIADLELKSEPVELPPNTWVMEAA